MTKDLEKTDMELDANSLPVDMENWNKNQLCEYREKLRFCFEHGVLPARYVDDKVNNKISEQKLDEAMACISYGLSLGLGAKVALEKTMVVNGQMTIWGEALASIIYRSGLMEYKKEYFIEETSTAVCEVKRKDQTQPEIRTFSLQDAKIAGLLGKGVWAKYPKRMLAKRACTYAFRDVFPDVLQGLITTEEAMEINQNDVLSEYSNVIAQPVVKKVEPAKVVEDVTAIEYTPIETVDEMLKNITNVDELGILFKDLKPKVNSSEQEALVNLFKKRKQELKEAEQSVDK